MRTCFTHVKAISRVFSKIEAINTAEFNLQMQQNSD